VLGLGVFAGGDAGVPMAWAVPWHDAFLWWRSARRREAGVPMARALS